MSEVLTEEKAEALIRYIHQCGHIRSGREGFRIPYIVAADWAEQGECLFSVSIFAARYGIGERSVRAAVRRLIDAGAIIEAGRGKDIIALQPVLDFVSAEGGTQ